MKHKLLIFGFILFLTLSILVIVSADDDDEGEEDDENEFGKKFGVAAMGLLGVGSIYIFIRRIVLWYPKISGSNPEVAKSMKRLFARFRPQLMLLHQVFMVLATGSALIHGLTVEREFESREIFGWAAAITMIIISTLGMLMWRQLRPFLKKIDLFTPIRFIHKQWILSVFLLIFLILHLGD